MGRQVKSKEKRLDSKATRAGGKPTRASESREPRPSDSKDWDWSRGKAGKKGKDWAYTSAQGPETGLWTSRDSKFIVFLVDFS